MTLEQVEIRELKNKIERLMNIFDDRLWAVIGSGFSRLRDKAIRYMRSNLLFATIL